MRYGGTCNDLHHSTKVRNFTATRVNVFTKLNHFKAHLSEFWPSTHQVQPATMHKIPLQTGISSGVTKILENSVPV